MLAVPSCQLRQQHLTHIALAQASTERGLPCHTPLAPRQIVASKSTRTWGSRQKNKPHLIAKSNTIVTEIKSNP